MHSDLLRCSFLAYCMHCVPTVDDRKTIQLQVQVATRHYHVAQTRALVLGRSHILALNLLPSAVQANYQSPITTYMMAYLVT